MFVAGIYGEGVERMLPIIGAEHRPNIITINKFGENPSIALNTEAVIWDGGGTYTYSTGANIDSASSADNSDGQHLHVVGLDANYTYTNQAVTLTGQTTVSLSIPLIRVFRAWNDGTAVFGGAIYIYENGSTVSSGVPSNSTNIRAVISSGLEQTHMAIFTIPKGMMGHMYDWWAGTDHKGTSFTEIKYYERDAASKVFLVKEQSVVGTAFEHHVYPNPRKLTQKTDIYMTGNPSVNNIAIVAGFDILLMPSTKVQI